MFGRGFSRGVIASETVEDNIAPILSDPTAVATGSTTATIGATTDEANGTMYVVMTLSSTPPTKAQIKAGQNEGGIVVPDSDSISVTSIGAKTFDITDLIPSTTYYSYIMHEDASGNQSNIAIPDPITMSA